MAKGDKTKKPEAEVMPAPAASEFALLQKQVASLQAQLVDALGKIAKVEEVSRKAGEEALANLGTKRPMIKLNSSAPNRDPSPLIPAPIPAPDPRHPNPKPEYYTAYDSMSRGKKIRLVEGDNGHLGKPWYKLPREVTI